MWTTSTSAPFLRPTILSTRREKAGEDLSSSKRDVDRHSKRLLAIINNSNIKFSRNNNNKHNSYNTINTYSSSSININSRKLVKERIFFRLLWK